MKPYNHEEAVVVGIEVRKHGRTRVREDRYRKSRGLKSVTFTLGTESPTPATGPTHTNTSRQGSFRLDENSLSKRVKTVRHTTNKWSR